MSRCQLCNRKLNKRWNYCPRCGAEVNKKINVFNLLRRQMDILRGLMFNDEFQEGGNQKPKSGITIRIDSRGSHQPHVRVFPGNPKSKPKKPKRPKLRKFSGNIIEPKVEKKRLADQLVFTIPLPNVKSEKNVELSRLHNSIELRAFAGDKGYFKILNVPRNHRLVDKSLDDGTLSLKFSI